MCRRAGRDVRPISTNTPKSHMSTTLPDTDDPSFRSLRGLNDFVFCLLVLLLTPWLVLLSALFFPFFDGFCGFLLDLNDFLSLDVSDFLIIALLRPLDVASEATGVDKCRLLPSRPFKV